MAQCRWSNNLLEELVGLYLCGGWCWHFGSTIRPDVGFWSKADNFFFSLSQMLLNLLSSSSRLFVAKDNPEPVGQWQSAGGTFSWQKGCKIYTKYWSINIEVLEMPYESWKNLSKNKPIALNGASCVYCHVHVQLPWKSCLQQYHRHNTQK